MILGGRLDELRLNVEDKRVAQAQLDTVNIQLADKPNPVIVREAGKTLRSLTEGAISSLIATAAQPTTTLGGCGADAVGWATRGIWTSCS